MCDLDGMQGAIKLALPEVKERPEPRKPRSNVIFLPDKELQELGVVRNAVMDFCGG